nr:ParB/RepB/Spo0J family partition protein [Chloroflexota bacterium]
IREHGVLQPILVRPSGSQFELIAGERRWRASRMAERATIPAIVVDFDESTALEVSIIENLQREDVSPLEEATMFRKMTETFGYSVRQLAQKLGKDKGYVENRLRLSDAPADIRELVSLRKDTISHAYELMKIGDERQRRRLARRIVAGDLSLAKLRVITGGGKPEEKSVAGEGPRRRAKTVAGELESARAADDALMGARSKLSEGVDDLVDILRQPAMMEQIPEVNRANFAKHLTITKLKIENAIAIIRSGAPHRDESD